MPNGPDMSCINQCKKCFLPPVVDCNIKDANAMIKADHKYQNLCGRHRAQPVGVSAI